MIQNTPPRAARRDRTEQRFGRTLTDPYGWLRDDNWQQVMRAPETLAADIRAHLEAENAWTEQVLAPIAELRKTLFEELKGRIKQDDSTVPAPDGAWEYYRRFATGGQYPVLCRKPRGTRDNAANHASEQILIDGNAEAESEKFFSIGGAAHSPDHRLFAAAIDRNGSEYCVVEIYDLDTGAVLPDRLDDALGDLSFSADSSSLFYTTLDENHRPGRILRHRIGSDAADDVPVHEDADPAFYISTGKTESGRFILIDAHDHSDTSETFAIDAAAPDTAPRLLWAKETGTTCDFSDHGERFFIRTNHGGALDFQIVEAPIADPSPENWRDVVPHRAGCFIRSMLVFEQYLVRLEREDALPRIVIRDIASGDEHAIEFDEEAYDLSLSPGYEFATTTLRFAYSSPTTPQRVFDYDMKTRERTLRKAQEIPSGHNPADYVCRRLFATGADGASVPVTVLHAKTTKLDGSAPLLLYGYGSYGISIPASFSPNSYSLVDRGFVHAIAHIRGGTERGYGWYLGGKLKNKKNTFLDYIAAAEMLIAENYSSAGAIVGQGRSAGGMLMGAVANMRPDLFSGILAEVPFVDVINTMSDESLPLTPPEWVEWGDPIHDEDAFNDMASYCPYTNVTNRRYPNVLATGGLTDPRVTYWEPAKWAARLRHHNTGDSHILCCINMEAGHGGASGRFDRLEEIALSWGFALMVSGMVSGKRP